MHYDSLLPVRDLLSFIDRSPTSFHAVGSCVAFLKEFGFSALCERDRWELSPGDLRYVTRNDGSIIAFAIGDESPARAGFRIVGAHTDSPHPQVKPNANTTKCGYKQLAVEPYGGMLFSTWFDRDLSLAGRVLLEDRDVPAGIRPVLVDLKRPLLRIPNLAIHLDREVNTRGLIVNQQQHLPPILGLSSGNPTELCQLQHMLCDHIKAEHGFLVEPVEILDWDLALYDTQKGTIAGDADAFIQVARLDNLASCHAALSALRESVVGQGKRAGTRMICFWDHEECGSRSMQGAMGPFIRQVIERIMDALAPGEGQAFHRAIASSFLVSADMAHAIHPNYSDRHEANHQPKMGAGPVIKTNNNQSYASDGLSCARFAALCKAQGFEAQRFVTRSDLPCGSTIGPITSSLLGIRSVDVGNPMLSMHSAREMAGAADHAKMIGVMKRFFDDDEVIGS
jgi:aspartyl aminopeptidase